MREILFRGKCKHNNNGWIYGNLIKTKNDKFWITNNSYSKGGWLVLTLRSEIEESTLGQFTGLLDKNGNKIFEGDIIQVMLPNNKPKRDFIAYVLWDSAFGGFRLSKYDYFVNLNSYGFEIIGNIHDNKELLK